MEIKSDIINCAFKARAERAQQHRSGEKGVHVQTRSENEFN